MASGRSTRPAARAARGRRVGREVSSLLVVDAARATRYVHCMCQSMPHRRAGCLIVVDPARWRPSRRLATKLKLPQEMV
jgi:hypothetical protein